MRSPGPSEPVLCFAAGGERFALASGIVQETLSLPRLTPLDDTPCWVLGAFELRGDLVPLVSLPMGIRPATPAASPEDLALVVRVGAQRLAIHANRLLSLLSPSPSRTTVGPSVAADACFPLRRIEINGQPAQLFDPTRIRLSLPVTELDIDSGSALAVGHQAADDRLAAFERNLDATARRRLDARARLCGIRVGPEHAADKPSSYLRVRIQGRPLLLRNSQCAGFMPAATVKHDAMQPPPVISATTTARGEALTVMDIRGALGLSPETDWQPGSAVILRDGPKQRAIAVDLVEQLINGQLRDLPAGETAIGGNAATHWLLGTVMHDGRALWVIDPETLSRCGGLPDKAQVPATTPRNELATPDPEPMDAGDSD